MVISQIIGGLGNQMFQYAAGKALAEFKGVEFKIDISSFENYKLYGYDLGNLAVTAPVASPEEINKFVGSRPGKVLKFLEEKFDWLMPYAGRKFYLEPFFNYNRRFFSLPPEVYLEGYFQSEKYFAGIKDIIKKEFFLKNEPGQVYDETAKKINETNSVAVHFRRGDYITNQGINKIFGTPPLEYYHTAVKKMAGMIKDPHFYIFSNDIEWVKNNFKPEYPTTYVADPALKNFHEISLMSKCRHNIIANSSFSWWGAWLNGNQNKIVVAPQRWFVWKKFNTKDIVPESWLRI